MGNISIGLHWLTMHAAIERAKRVYRRDGIIAVLQRAASCAGRVTRRWAYSSQRHGWYLLNLCSERPHRKLSEGFALARAGEDELTSLEQLPTVGYLEGRRLLFAGADLWIVRGDGHPVFSCWIFRDRTPVFAAHGGWLELPPGIVCLECSVTAPRYRGRGIAPAAYCAIADTLAGEGVAAIVMKIEEGNVSSRRAVEKVGFHEIAAMHFLRVGPWSHVDLRLHDAGASATFLVERLAY